MQTESLSLLLSSSFSLSAKIKLSIRDFTTLSSSIGSTSTKAPDYETVKLTASNIEEAQLHKPFDKPMAALP